MKNALDKYIKKNEVGETVNSSVKITKEQKQFIDENRINLSEFIRDMLDELIERTKQSKKK